MTDFGNYIIIPVVLCGACFFALIFAPLERHKEDAKATAKVAGIGILVCLVVLVIWVNYLPTN